MYLYRAVDSNGDTVEFWFSERRNLTAAKRFLRRALKRHGWPERIILGGIEMVHMMRKGQTKYARNSNLSLAEQFEQLVA